MTNCVCELLWIKGCFGRLEKQEQKTDEFRLWQQDCNWDSTWFSPGYLHYACEG